MKKIFIIILICFSLKGFTQQDNINPKAIKQYDKAVTQIQEGDYANAIIFLQNAIALDENYVAAFLSLAGVYGEQKQYQLSIDNYRKAFAKDSINTKFYLLPYSINLAGMGLFDEAFTAVEIFLQIPGLSDRSLKSGNYRKRCYAFAVDYKIKHPNTYTFNPINLGDSVNTSKSEYYPSLAIADSLLIFTRRGQGYAEDFYKSIAQNNKYSKAEFIEGSLNAEAAKGAVTVSSDGDYLVFAADFGRKGFGNFDLYISYSTPDGWSEPENLGYAINSEYWESAPSLSPDNKTLYFCSDRAGGYGGKDLYKCERLPNGRWGKAINMGGVINSNGDDLYPYIHPDNQTLYFASNGHLGYGNTDLFICRKDVFGDWQKPENLGYPINTINDEGSIAISSDGGTAYYASDRSDSYGGLDIYRFEMPEAYRPFKTIFVRGRVTDAKTGKGVPCSLELTDNTNATSLLKIQVDELGKYFIPLPVGKDFTFTVNRKGYLYYSKSLDFSQYKPDSTYVKDIALTPIELKANFVFNNVQFETNSFKLLDISKIELDKLVQVLNENPSIKIIIKGHTDSIGKANDNLLLSTNRAKAVVDYCISKGIDAARLSFKGFGSSVPLATNKTEQGRAKNRRTEFEIVGL